MTKEIFFKNKNILITGSSSGIGFGIAKSYGEFEANVILNGRNREKLIQSSKQIHNSIHICSDVSKKVGRELIYNRLIKKNIKLDILICNVGYSSPPKSGLNDSTSWIKSFESNFLSSAHLINLLSQGILNEGSSIVCISSICSLRYLGCPTTYACSKAALNTFVEQQSKTLAKFKIRLNAVVPGHILFKGSVWEKKIKKNSRSIKKMINSSVPLQRFGYIEDVTNAVIFLSSDKSNYITGVKLPVDGGVIS